MSRTGAFRATVDTIAAACDGTAVRCVSRAAVIVATLGALLALAPAALAQSQRGHAFSFAFGAPGKGTEQFDKPSGIALDNATGDVYVADTANNRVEEFKPKLNASKELVGETYVNEFAVPAPEDVAVDNSTGPSTGDVYVVGASKEGGREAEPEEKYVYKFTSEGVPIMKIGHFTGGEELEDIEGVAVDPAGDLFVYEEDELIYEFSGAEKNVGLASLDSDAATGKPGLAVGGEGRLYVAAEEAAGADEAEEELTELIKEEDEQDGLTRPFAVVSEISEVTGDVQVPELDPEDTLAVAVDPLSEPGDEVAESFDVYTANLAPGSSGPQTTIAEFSPRSSSNPHGALIQRFTAPGLQEGAGVAVDASTGTVYVTDARSDDVDVFEVEADAAPTLAGLSACTVQTGPEHACAPAAGVTILEAQVDPRGLETKYHFEYGPESCTAVPSTCTSTPERSVAASFGEQAADAEVKGLPSGVYRYRAVATNALGTSYSEEGTFTIVAAAAGLPDGREWEMVSPTQKVGATLEPIPPAGGLIEASASGNAITYVGEGVLPSDQQPEGDRNGEYTQVLSSRGAAGWGSTDITTANTVPQGLLPGLPQEYQDFSPDLALALVEPFPGPQLSGALAAPPLSPPLSKAEEGNQEKTMYLRDDAPVATLQPQASEQGSYEAAKANGVEMHNAGYLPLVTAANAPGGEPFGGGTVGLDLGVEFLAASPDLSHVVLASRRAKPGLYEWGVPDETPSVKDATERVLAPVSILPDGELVPPGLAAGVIGPSETAELGGSEGNDTDNAVSEDGALVFWTLVHGEESDLYVRDTVTHETLKLDMPEAGGGTHGAPEAIFQTASVDGSKVFFTDTQRLTSNSRATSGEPDLYVAELTGGRSPGSPLAVNKVEDLTPEGDHGESANVQAEAHTRGGGVIGASADGTHVYFVADGALSPGAARGRCAEEAAELASPHATCNLYERVFAEGRWTPTKLVAVLSSRDAPDWNGKESSRGEPGDLASETARVSPNGEYLAFMSERSLTGYDNEDVTSKQPGERMDEEVYLYEEAGGGHLTCASCNPDGGRPEGIFDSDASTEDGQGLLVDRPEVWASDHKTFIPGEPGDDAWLAGNIPGWTPISGNRALYQSRYLSDAGRLFFNSPSHLVAASETSKEKVYEYERSGTGSCQSGGGCVALISSGSAEQESALLDASVSGNDVFFLTAERLVPQDPDQNFDVYDAHVCEFGPPCIAGQAPGLPVCKSLPECRPGESTPAPAYAAPASAAVAIASSASATQVLSSKVSSAPPPASEPKPLTRAQKLAKALKACKKEKKSKRGSCERAARKRYGPIKKKAAVRRSESVGSKR